MQSYENVSAHVVDLRPRSRAERSYYLVSLSTIPIALELMLQLPICPSRDVEGYRRTCGRNGKLLGVCVLQLIET
jgi:hypothetical protein